MSCCGANVTPLAHYARSMAREIDEVPMHFPMYTVPLGELLDMTVIEPHEKLKARDALVEFNSTMGRAAFVSHQWVTTEHPDPECKQMRVLQKALKDMMLGKNPRIPVDQVSEIVDPHAKPLPAASLFSKPLFFWYDYCSCPQGTRLSRISDEQSPGSGLLHAINSIPAYVDKCAFFFGLIPCMETPSGTDFISPLTWQERGWCRLERTCRELSLHDSSWVMVRSPSDLEIVSGTNLSARFGAGPVGEGYFSLPEDRWKLRPVLIAAIKRKILSLLQAQDWPRYRSLLNQQAMMLRGLESESEPQFEPLEFDPDSNRDFPSTSKFFHQNGFRGIRETDAGGWSPLHYAALDGNPSLVQELLTLKADPNQGTKRSHPDLGFECGTSPLCISCLFKRNDAARVLIAAKARVACRGLVFQPLTCAATANNAEAIKLLCEARCNLLQRTGFGVNALMSAAYSGGVQAMDELRQASTFNPTEAVFAFSISAGAETVRWLVGMNADVNDQTCRLKMVKSTLLHRAVGSFLTLQHRLGRVTSASTQYYHSPGATPLMMAILMGNYECAAALIAAGAQLHLRNSRGWTAADFARWRSVPEFLQEALEGRVEACQRVSLLATGWVEMRF
ncbi:unnamed protein product [Effrenium voratum]|nr:unnamed protein product [Effrenium voratum]